MYLLDANVLIALADPQHVEHQRAQAWFHRQRGQAWATCPLTENAFLRILGQPNYPGSPGPPSVLRPVLQQICSLPGHQFWQDSISLIDPALPAALPASKHLTDFYLLALAIHKKGALATFDRRIDPSLLKGGKAAYLIIQ